MDDTKLTSAESAEESDFYLPAFLLPYLPSSPHARDLVMLGITILVGTLISMIAMMLINETLGVVLGCLSIGNFFSHYWWRVVRRTMRLRRDKEDLK